jgi:hypothetical protein
MTAFLYGKFLADLCNGIHDFSTHTFNIILCTDSYTPNVATDNVLTDVNTDEVSGTGYTTGGAQIVITSVAYSSTANALIIQADNVQWPSSTITARYAVLYNGTATNNPLVGYFDFGVDEVSTNGLFELDVSSSGLINMTP